MVTVGWENAPGALPGFTPASIQPSVKNGLPVRARLVSRAEDWPWSSVRAHFARADDHVVRVAPALDRIGDFRAFLREEFDEDFTYAALRKAETIGRPVGSREWLEDMAARTGRALLPGKRGPKPKGI